MNKITTLVMATLVAINSRPVNASNHNLFGIITTAGGAAAIALSEAWCINRVNKHTIHTCERDKIKSGIAREYFYSLLDQDNYWSRRQLSTIDALVKQGRLDFHSFFNNSSQLLTDAIIQGDEISAKSCLNYLKEMGNSYSAEEGVYNSLKKADHETLLKRLRLLKKIGLERKFITVSVVLFGFLKKPVRSDREQRLTEFEKKINSALSSPEMNNLE